MEGVVSLNGEVPVIAIAPYEAYPDLQEEFKISVHLLKSAQMQCCRGNSHLHLTCVGSGVTTCMRNDHRARAKLVSVCSIPWEMPPPVAKTAPF